MKAAYELSEVYVLIKESRFRLTRRAQDEANAEFDFTPKQVGEACLELTEADFHQTIRSNQTGRLNDVYIKKIYSDVYKRTVSTYIKLEILENLIIVSFHSQTHF